MCRRQCGVACSFFDNDGFLKQEFDALLSSYHMYISWTILVVVCCMCRTEAARSATVTVCSYPPPTAASCSCSPLNGRWLSLVQCLPGRPSCDTVSPITHSVPFYKLLHSVNSQLLSLVINKFGFKTSLRSSLILKDSQLELLLNRS